MSKSIGNVVNPDEIVDKYGSDVLRLWAVSANFKNDVNIGPEIIKQVAENKRKIRNTLRFILGNHGGYKENNSLKEFRWIDKLMLAKLKDFNDSCTKLSENYDFPVLVQQICRFCVQDLSAFYFEILKDRLYTEPLDSPLRQGAQTVLMRILRVLIDKIDPIMPFLIEEIKGHLSTDIFTCVNNNIFNNVNIEEFDWIQRIRADYLEWFNTRGKSDLNVKSTFQLDMKIISSHQQLKAEDFKEIFMVASVELTAGEQFEITEIRASDRLKCPRCWTFNSQNLDDLCPACINQMKKSSEDLKLIKQS